ncbi:propanol dehydrogenase [Streptococcus sanguinis SK1 = NCTC 7863]|jgi:pduQ protein, putative|uniref:Aldehyde-alcohol dehydrogenase n=3 Tax=Streptococcus sanguinis TaxID=1305 RepID=A0ABD7JMU3_STRSA|nr:MULTISPECIES: 1-propanol dehydrogenase PduQ [Streptococcus]PLA63452.1 alcohol dehydrogenase [Streptococcus salivarius]EGC25446.1 alcohol dehydrogenase, iron-dependent [Streptococcus sanguinis SK405]EGF08130.1 propanol dehydrogenase [Streptococcus sanguinis SK1 = NCTC 7863]EGF18955.1 propanol dehydrogenase [Streptococcus sanguinis SK408]EGF20878.1 propanol dehydrogenase [Streptococcus sanguinis SK1058]
MYKISYKTELHVGKGALQQLSHYKNEHILVVADPFLKTSGTLDAILANFDDNNDIVVFTDIVPDPPIETVVAGIKSAGDKPISIVLSIGGGSAIDASKAMYYFAKKQGAFSEAILIAIPTTSGTGSEVTSFSVITDAERGTKYPLVTKEILPDVAILDADLVLSLPGNITADTGMDVLTHAIEAYVSTKATDFSDALAEKAIKLVFEYLPKAYKNGQDVEAREKMHAASTLAGMAFNTASLGINHSLAHAAGAKFHVPHGRLNSILMPHVIQYNAGIEFNNRNRQATDKTVASRYQDIAKLLGCSASSPVSGVRQLVEAIKKLQRKLEMPTSLREYGVKADAFAQYKVEISEAALHDGCTPTNPRVPTAEELLKVLEKAF